MKTAQGMTSRWLAAAVWLAATPGSTLLAAPVGAHEVQPMRPVSLEQLQQSQPTSAPVALALSDNQERDLQLLLSVLREPRVEVVQRREAARALLDRGWLDAVRAMVRELEAQPGDAATQQIIAQAVAEHPGDPPLSLQDPLLGLLSRVDEARLIDVAAALGRFQDVKLERTLVRQALDGGAPGALRQRWAMALGYFRSQIATEALLELTAPQQPADLRLTAFNALAQLTGITDFGADRARWQAWWKQNKDDSRSRWLLTIIENLARRNRDLQREREQTELRVLDGQRAVYRVTPEEGRPAVLLAMLSDAWPSMRLLGVELADQRFVTDAKAPTPELRAALMARLDDPVPAVRRRAVRLLRELKDESAADTIAQRLVADQEPDRDVVKAYLSLMARLPRAEVCPKAIALLSDPEMRSDAAAVLVAAADARLLTDVQTQQIARVMRQQIHGDVLPEPSVVALLGRMGDEQDWQRILGWLDSSDAGVKRAAAEAWAASEQLTYPLAERASDPVIQPIAINAVARRGKEGRTLLALLEHKPRQEQTAQAWQRALVAMAGRVAPSFVLRADQVLLEREEPAVLRDQLLTAAIERIEPRHSAGDLLLARAEVRVALGDGKAALADLALLESAQPGLNAQQTQRWNHLTLRAQLSGGDVDAALAMAERLCQQAKAANPSGWHSDVEPVVVQSLLAAARRAVTGNQIALASRMVERLEAMLQPRMPESQRQRLAELKQQIAGATPVAPVAPATPGVSGVAPATSVGETAPAAAAPGGAEGKTPGGG